MDHSHHIIPIKVLVQVFTGLLVLTILTVAVAQFDFGSMNTVIAVLVASVKAFLVGAFFMGLKYSEKIFTVCLISAVFFVVLLFAFVYLDIVTRVFEQSTL